MRLEMFVKNHWILPKGRWEGIQVDQDHSSCGL